MKIPKVGLKTTDIAYNEADKIEIDTLEIITKDRNVNLSGVSAERVKKRLKGKNLSFHTGVSRFLKYDKKDIREMEIQAVKSEILYCKIIGIKEYIFHITERILTKKEENILKEIIRFAKKNNVEMIYESNKHFKAKTCLDFMKRFPNVNYNLDIGHLNTAIGSKTLGMPLEKFIEKVQDRIIYIHVHNNNGKDDEHKGLEEGTLDWKYVLDLIDLSKIRKIVMEIKPQYLKKSKRLLEGYLKKRAKRK